MSSRYSWKDVRRMPLNSTSRRKALRGKPRRFLVDRRCSAVMKRFCTPRVEYQEKDQQSALDKSLSRFPLYDFRRRVSRLGRTFVEKWASGPVAARHSNRLKRSRRPTMIIAGLSLCLGSVCGTQSHAGSADPSHQPAPAACGKSLVPRQFRSMATASRIYRAFRSSEARPRTAGAGISLSKSGSS